MIDATLVTHNPYGGPDTIPDLKLPRLEEQRTPRASGYGTVRLPESGVRGFVINHSNEGLLVALWGPIADGEAMTVIVRRDGHESAFTAVARWTRRVADGLLVGFALDLDAEEMPLPLTKPTGMTPLPLVRPVPKPQAKPALTPRTKPAVRKTPW